MAKLSPISGFPEWLPEQKLVEEKIIEKVRAIYVSHGFTPIETPSVELLSHLVSKGVVDKELYVLNRARAEEGEEAKLGLHFDLTAPFARYVAQHYEKLDFPFRRYQLQRAWRGDRPQRGRFREFYQFDVDIIARDELPLSCDAEVLTVLEKAFRSLGFLKYRVNINNRKILQGFYKGLGLDEAQRKAAITVVDKIDKIGPEGVRKELVESTKVSAEVAARILELSAIRLEASQIASIPSLVKCDDELLRAGVDELARVVELVPEETRASLDVNLSLARGLDYYTGLILEVRLPEFPEYGSVGGGGRYEDLAGQFLNKKLPGVGVSFGLTRLMDLFFSSELLKVKDKCPTKVLVTVYSEAQRGVCNQIAERVRLAGLACEVFFKDSKLGKQLDYALAKGIPYVLFVSEGTNAVEVKDLANKEQKPVSDLEEWCKAVR